MHLSDEGFDLIEFFDIHEQEDSDNAITQLTKAIETSILDGSPIRIEVKHPRKAEMEMPFEAASACLGQNELQ